MKQYRLKKSIAISFFLSLMFLVIVSLSAQPRQVTGTVTSAADGATLPGVNVVIKGAQKGTITDVNGKYSIEVSSGDDILVFSYVGYNTEEITVGNQSVIDIQLVESIESLSEIVVTALGIKREERSLGFSVGRVDGKEVNKVAQENVLNALSGRVAGVTINSTGGTGSSVSMVIRGATSLSTDNQPLFVVDGVPIINTLNNMTQFGDRNIVDYGNSITDINPEDVESISILKGPSAAALYGTRAGNGVVLITTKSGSKNKKATVTFTSNTVFDKPYSFLKVQKKFASGYFSFTPDNFGPGVYPTVDPAQMAGAGMELDRGYFAFQWNAPLDSNGFPVPTELVSYPDNEKNFVQTGITTTNGISLANSNEAIDYRVGVTNMSSRGVVPGSDLFRNNLTLNSTLRASKRWTFSTNININRTYSNNRPASNRGANPMEWVYKFPRNIDIREVRDYWEPGQEGLQQRTTWLGKPEDSEYNNPYFLAYEIDNRFNRDRIFGNLKAEWEIIDGLTLMGRYSVDYYVEERETKIPPSYTREPNNGTYGIVKFNRYEMNADFLATYTKQFGKFGLNVSVGGNDRYTRSSSITNSSASGLVVPNVFTVNNIKSSGLRYGSGWSQKAIYSVYGLANLSWDDFIYLDLTARNDWSSTLSKENWSYFYPSASLSLLVNEMFSMGSNVNMIKLRGGWAQVGNDASPYQLYQTYGNAGQWGEAIRLVKSGTILTPNLKAELATSWETGVDLSLFGSRLRFEGTVYQVDNENQILRNIKIAASSGYTNMNINAGLIRSRGIELLLAGTPIQRNGWTWDLSANWSRNRTRIIELSPGIEVIKFWDDAKGGAFTYVGDEIGDIYDAKLIVVEDPNSPYYGYPIINPNTDPWQAVRAEDTRNKVGNYNPDFILGMTSSLSWKNLSLSFTLDWRSGGQYVSQTYRYTTSGANSQIWIDRAINPEGRRGKELRDWLVANEDKYIKNGFYVVGGPAGNYGGFPESWSGLTVNDGYFVPGVIQIAGADTPEFEDDVYVEHLGEDLSNMTVLPWVVSFPWDFATPTLFDADFVKLRDASITYNFPSDWVRKIKLQNMSLSLYTRNIVIWTKGKNGIDPERAFQAEAGSGNRGTQFKQGIERYNVDPWVIPIGFKLNVSF